MSALKPEATNPRLLRNSLSCGAARQAHSSEEDSNLYASDDNWAGVVKQPH